MAADMPAAAPRPAGRRRWSIHLALITSYLLGVGLAGWRRAGSGVSLFSNRRNGVLFVSAVELALFGLLFGLAWLASRASRDDLLLKWRGGFWPVPLGIAYSIALRLALIVVVLGPYVVLVVSRLVTPDAAQAFLRNHSPNIGALVDLPAMRSDAAYFWWMVTIVSFVVAGLREELWRSAFLAGLRNVWPKAFASRAGRVGAVAIAAVVFGFAHLSMGPAAVVLAAVVGFGLGLIMILHRSIWPAVIAHGAFDATTMAMIPWLMEHVKHYEQGLR
jgi:membrane protease YdiL (CAAX protease family)